MVRGQFPGQSLVNESRLVILSKAHCKHIERFIGVTCTVSMNDGNHVSLSNVSALREAWRDDRCGADGDGHRPWRSTNHVVPPPCGAAGPGLGQGGRAQTSQ